MNANSILKTSRRVAKSLWLNLLVNLRTGYPPKIKIKRRNHQIGDREILKAPSSKGKKLRRVRNLKKLTFQKKRRKSPNRTRRTKRRRTKIRKRRKRRSLINEKVVIRQTAVLIRSTIT